MGTTTLPHWLTKRAHLTPHHRALEFVDGTTLSFLELHERSALFARQLAHLGIAQGKRVAILSNNQLDMIIAAHALSYLGAVAVMLNTRLTTPELTYQLTASRACCLLTTSALQIEKALHVKDTFTFTEVMRQEQADIALVEEISLDDPYTMMFTSGTTGHPKAVMHTYGNHWWSATASALNIGLHDQDKWLLPLPIFHIGGFSILLKSVIYGIPAFVMEKYASDLFYEVIRDKQITIISLVTLMLNQFIDKLGEEKLPEHVRCLLLGGGSVPEALLQKVKEKEIPLFQSYGMTETSSQIVTLSADDALRKLGSSGKSLFPAQIDIIDQQADGVGEIVVKGPMVMDGYVDNPKANDASFINDWLKTGDLGYLDEEGFLYVVERRSDLIISGGENIYPSEIESKLLTIAGVLDVGVFGRKDDKWGQIPIACIVRNDEQVTESVILHQLQQVLATYKLPKEIFFVDELPRNASNKLMRHQLHSLIDEKI